MCECIRAKTVNMNLKFYLLAVLDDESQTIFLTKQFLGYYIFGLLRRAAKSMGYSSVFIFQYMNGFQSDSSHYKVPFRIWDLSFYLLNLELKVQFSRIFLLKKVDMSLHHEELYIYSF